MPNRCVALRQSLKLHSRREPIDWAQADTVKDEGDYEKQRRSKWGQFIESVERAVKPKIHSLGSSGAQFGAGRNLALITVRKGWAKALSELPEDRLIQVSRRWPPYTVRAVAPSWLENTQRAIQESRAPSDREATGDGHWLSQAVANAAHDFFEYTGDLLPSEPYIYSSRQGDLVAECKGEHGTLTAIVASTFVLLFAVIDNMPFQRRVAESQDLRQEVRRFTDALRSGSNGTLDAKK